MLKKTAFTVLDLFFAVVLAPFLAAGFVFAFVREAFSEGASVANDVAGFLHDAESWLRK